MFSRVSNFCHNQFNSDVAYHRKNPQTLVVFIPLVSSLVQSVQVNNIKMGFINSPRMPDSILKRLKTNYTWNALGSLVQAITFLALAIFTHLLFLPFAPLATHQFCKSADKIKEMHHKLHIVNDNRIIDEIWKALSKDNTDE